MLYMKFQIPKCTSKYINIGGLIHFIMSNINFKNYNYIVITIIKLIIAIHLKKMQIDNHSLLLQPNGLWTSKLLALGTQLSHFKPAANCLHKHCPVME